MKQNRIVALAALACAVAAVGIAQQKVAGEKWRMKVSMQTEGFSMPGRTMEMCLPKERIQEAMLQQQQEADSNCRVLNQKQSGNKFSADIQCSGDDGMEGHVEMEQLGPDSMRGRMNGKSGDMTMKMEYEYTKLGQACEAVDYSSYKPPVANVAVPQIDYCQRIHDDISKGSGNLAGLGAGLVQGFPKADGSGMQDCTSHASFQKFCSAVQTPAGFADLEFEQWQRRSLPANAEETAYTRMTRSPLTESMSLCKLGTGDDAIAKLQKQMAAAARKEGQWGFVMYYDANAQYDELQALAKKECSGRSFTNAANQQYLGLCSRYGTMLVRNDRAGVLEAAGCTKERENAGRGICVGATSTSGSAMASMSGAAGGEAAASGSASNEAAAEDKEATAKDKAKDALDKGKKALRGLFGG